MLHRATRLLRRNGSVFAFCYLDIRSWLSQLEEPYFEHIWPYEPNDRGYYIIYNCFVGYVLEQNVPSGITLLS